MTLVAADIAEQPDLLEHLLTAQRAALSRVADLVATHRSVRLAGIGSSRHVAAYGAACLEVYAGVPTSVLASPGQGVPQPRLGPDDLLLLVSQSGQTPALLHLAAAARSSGTTVVSLTNTPGSPLEELADLALPASAGPEHVVPATKSVTTSMLLLRALAGPVDPGASAQLSVALRGLSDASLPVLFRPLPSVVVSGGFAGQAVADEVALKLAEMVAHVAAAESVVDFLHGPAAVPGPALAFLDEADPNAGAVATRPGVLTVGPGRDVPLASCGDASLDAIARVIAGQCLALQWALALGIDPDDARGLQKVTLTA
ncbi:MAG: glmS1 [Frankiales bacterium]|nr:glmS1 [Frankiales bacterium]